MHKSQYPISLIITADEHETRLDQVLVAHYPDVSRARMRQVIDEGKVRVNGEEEKPSYKVRKGDQIVILGPAERPPLRAIAEDIPLDIVYEDDDIAVINKPAGMMVHAGAGATEDERNRGTLVNALLHRFGALSSVGGELRPGIVHRLDRETSGLIVVAKNDLAHRKLSEQFASRTVNKRYIALVHGWMKHDEGKIEAAISRDAVRRNRMTTRRSGGREAVSRWKIIERIDGPYGKFSLVEVKIDTGRTHQIRVHMASVGHPVVGDTLYGAPKAIVPIQKRTSSNTPGEVIGLDRNFLHAGRIEFLHPCKATTLRFSVALPQELQEFLITAAGAGTKQ